MVDEFDPATNPSSRTPQDIAAIQSECIINGNPGRSEVSMRRPLCAILAAFVFVTILLQAQERNPQFSGSAALSTSSAGTTIVNLLQQSHDLGQQLPVSMRLNMLRRQALMVSKSRADIGREWANELFTLSFQAKEGHRAVAQETAMSVLI